MATVRLKFRPSALSKTEGTLYYQVIHRRKVKWISTDYHIFTNEWNEKKESIEIPINGKRKAELQLKQSITKWELQRRMEVIHKLEAANKDVTLDELCETFKQIVPCKTVFTFMQEQVVKQEQMKRQGTAKTYYNAYHNFKKFREDIDLTFDELSPDMMERYEAWLIDQRLKQNSICCYLRTLCTLLHKAINEEQTVERNLFNRVRLTYVKTAKRAISEKELRSIASLQLSAGSSIAFARDVFMFSFYMRGMPFVDIAYLRKTDLRIGMLTYSRKKTQQSLTVACEEAQKAIIERYAHLTENSPYLFPIIQKTDGTEYIQYQRMLENVNRALKKIGKMAGVSIPLTTYVARHTWASMARDMDISIAIISEGMGHRSLNTTQVYLSSISTSKINEANKKIIQRISTGV